MVTKSVIFLTKILIFTNLVNSELVYPAVVSSDCPIHGPSNAYAPVQGLPPLVYSPSVQNDPNEINEELGKIIVSKLLTNPTLNAILNQHYGVHQHNVPSTPNVVNNYFIVPKDILEVKENEDIVRNQKKTKARGVQNLVHETPKTGKVDGYHTFTEYVNGVPVEHKYNHGQKRRYTNIPYGVEHDIEDVPRQAKHTRKHKSHKQYEYVPRKEKPITKKQSPKRHKQISPQDLAIINDFKRKYPGLPDNIIYNMFFRMKRQFTKAHPRDTNKKEAPAQIEVKPVEKEVEKKVQPKPRRRIKPANENRVTEKVSNDTVAITTEKSTPVTIKHTQTTTEPAIVTTQPTTYKYFSSIHTSKPIDTTTKKIDIDEMVIPELGTEDAVPTIYSNYGDSDDYYPDFTMDSNFYVLGEDYEMEPKQTVTRHASEKNYNAPDIENQQRTKQHRLHQRPKHSRKNPRNRHNSRRRYQNHKTKLNQTQEHSPNDDGDFKIPPGLDNPGFVTTKVKSNYESVNDSENEVFVSPKRNENVETVFASSKVVNYGHVKDYSDEETTTTVNNRYYIDDNGDISSDRTASVVIAKSYNYPEDYS